MKKFLCAAIFVLAFCAALFAQNDSSTSCPTVSVDGPSRIVNPGETATFSVKVDNFDSEKLTYNWTTSIGQIVEGQGTPIIIIKTPVEWTQGLIATVKIEGLPKGCENTDSEMMVCSCKPPQAEKIDEFGKATNGGVKLRFDNFMLKLQEDPTAQAYIINYGSDKEVAKRERQLLNAMKLDAMRITFVRGGDSGEGVKTQFWVVPAGATPPKP